MRNTPTIFIKKIVKNVIVLNLVLHINSTIKELTYDIRRQKDEKKRYNKCWD